MAVLVVADRAADLDEDDVGVGLGRQLAELELDLAGDVRDDLHVAAEVAALALLLQHGGHDLAVGREVGGRQVLVEQALVGAQVHVGFHAVIQHEDFAVAVGVQRAGVDVEVALHLDRRDLQALVLEQLGQRRGEDPLAQPAHDRADDDDVLVVPPAIPWRHRRVELGLFRRLADLGQQVFVLVHSVVAHLLRHLHLRACIVLHERLRTAPACRCRAWRGRPSGQISTGRAPGHAVAPAFRSARSGVGGQEANSSRNSPPVRVNAQMQIIRRVAGCGRSR